MPLSCNQTRGLSCEPFSSFPVAAPRERAPPRNTFQSPPAGGRHRLFVPPQLAYGATGCRRRHPARCQPDLRHRVGGGALAPAQRRVQGAEKMTLLPGEKVSGSTAPPRIGDGSFEASRSPFREKLGTPPGFIPPQLAALVKQPPDGPAYLHEIKLDGYRMAARLHNGDVRLL